MAVAGAPAVAAAPANVLAPLADVVAALSVR